MAFWDGQRWIRPTRGTPEQRPHRVRDLIATIPIAALPVILAIAVLARAAGPTLAAPAIVSRGATVSISGTSFPRNARLQLTWDETTDSMPTARTDRSGSFTAHMTVPGNAALGSHTIAAVPVKGSRISRTSVLASVTVVVALPASASPSATATPTPRVTPAPTATPRPTPTPSPRSTPTPTPTPAGSGPIRHVIVVWLENNEYSSVTSSSMPYLTSLASQYGLATNYDAVSHPSEPNYVGFWAGSTSGVTDDGTYNLSGASLSTQFQNAGLSWQNAEQDYPTTAGCHTGTSYSGIGDGPQNTISGTYARKHDPAMSFTLNGGASCANITSLAAADFSRNLVFVTPNLCNDAHDCSLATADHFLAAFLPSVFSAPDWSHTLLVVTFDEGTSGTGGGGHVYTMVARAGLSHFTSATLHNHYGLTRTIENIFGLGCLNSACTAAPLTEFLP